MYIKRIKWLVALLIFPILSAQSLAAINADYPDRPRLEGDLINDSTLYLKWTKDTSDHFKRYHVLQSDHDRNPEYLEGQAIWSTDDVDQNAYQVSDLDPEETYYFKVCTNNTDNKTTCSNIIHINKYDQVRSLPVYVDIYTDDWFKSHVDELQSHHILPVYDRTFEPDRPISRGEFTEWVVKALTDEDLLKKEIDYFCDLHTKDKYINYLKELGAIDGYVGGSCNSNRVFRPYRTINRAEAIKLIMVAFDVDIREDKINYAEDPDDSNIAVDVNQTDWYAPYVYWAAKAGITDTNDEGYFRPNEPLRRANAAKILAEAIASYQ